MEHWRVGGQPTIASTNPSVSTIIPPMPRIFDNINDKLLPALQQTLEGAAHADFCVGYFNLRGWRDLATHVDNWQGGEGRQCRLLIGMHITPSEELRQILRGTEENPLDNQTANREKRRIAQEFRDQLTFGAPSNADEATLRQLARQLRAGKLVVKVFLRHPLHAKLYLIHRQDPIAPTVGYVGSSNLTLAGLARQGELNVDVVDSDATQKLASWFAARWTDRWCLDISKELADIIDASWAGDRLVPPYHVYLKMAYHLSQEARAGLAEFRTPAVFGKDLLDFQLAAVKIAAHHLHRRGGVLIGDVVGLGKSIMASALAKIFEEDFSTETLIICPKNLVPMWQDYRHKYQLRASVLPISKALSDLPEMPRYRIVLIDESHNLRNKESKRWRVIRDYIERNDSQCILLSATPYNKTYMDLAAQLGLFIPEDRDLGIRPEKLIQALKGEHHFTRLHQCPVRSIAAFEKSEEPDDWRDLMRLYMVRRTRSFVMQHYAQEDAQGKYLQFADGSKSYFPQRLPKTLKFKTEPQDPYARLYADQVVDSINSLTLPRYGLANYLAAYTTPPAEGEFANGTLAVGGQRNGTHLELTADQLAALEALSRAGTRLMGFCRTNLFKRLESAGPSFLTSIERHALRNFVVIQALEQGAELPLGPQTAELLDSRLHDADLDTLIPADVDDAEDQDDSPDAPQAPATPLHTEADYRATAKAIYKAYAQDRKLRRRFKWLPCQLFTQGLLKDLTEDARKLLAVLNHCGIWQPSEDAKLKALTRLLKERHPNDKALVFTQFADTADYLGQQLQSAGLGPMAVVTGDTKDPTAVAWRFSPVANGKRALVPKSKELRVLVSTDVLSEGQNLQDCALVVNYDLPWAIIRLIQRTGRVDRIGQLASQILCYSFLPAEGVERLINLRGRVRQRLAQNGEVIGSDETYFPGEEQRVILDLYNEKSGVLDDQADTEVDLASYAYQIWKDATDARPELASQIEALPNVVYATKAHEPRPGAPKGALVYMRTPQDNDTLAWMAEDGAPATQSQLAILNAAACAPDTPGHPRTEAHHALTQKGLEHIIAEERATGGALGRPTGARFRAYERLKRHRSALSDKPDILNADRVQQLDKALEAIYRHPLRQQAKDTLNNHLRTGIDDYRLADLVLGLLQDGRLCHLESPQEQRDPKLICSLGLA